MNIFKNVIISYFTVSGLQLKRTLQRRAKYDAQKMYFGITIIFDNCKKYFNNFQKLI